MNILRKLINRINSGQPTGEVERYYFAYDQSKVLESIWAGHYIIYRKFVQIAERIPTLDLCCGCGAGTKLISESLRIRVAGVDYSAESVNYAKKYNSDSFTEYYVLDLNNRSDLSSLKRLVKSQGLRQVFFIEGIEHIRQSDTVVTSLLESGVERIFVSTPFEQEGTRPQSYHVNPFTPKVYEQFAARFSARIICYCKPTLVADVRDLVGKGFGEEYLMQKYLTSSTTGARNYLIEISCPANSRIVGTQ